MRQRQREAGSDRPLAEPSRYTSERTGPKFMVPSADASKGQSRGRGRRGSTGDSEEDIRRLICDGEMLAGVNGKTIDGGKRPRPGAEIHDLESVANGRNKALNQAYVQRTV